MTVQLRQMGWNVYFTACCLAVLMASAGPLWAQAPTLRPPSLPPPASPAIVPLETLDDAWSSALANDQRLEASQWNLAAAQSTWAAARAEMFPSMSLGGNYYALSEQPKVSAHMPFLPTPLSFPIIDQSSVGFHALVSQPIYTFGRISNGIAAAQDGVRANEAEVQRTRLDIKMNVAEIYVIVLRAARVVDVVEAKVLSLGGHNKDVTNLFDKGLVSRNDLLAAQVAWADSRQQAMQARNGLQVARAAYNRALGRDLTQPVNLAELQDDEDVGDVAELTGLAMQLRPELAGLSAQARSLQNQSASERARNAPQVSVAGGYLYQENQQITPDGMAGVLVSVEWNAFDSGRVSNRAASLCEKAEAVIRTRRDAETMIALEVRQKWIDLQTARERLEVTRQATAQADENLRVVRERYQQQVGTNTEVLDAETLRVQAYTNFYNSTYESVLARLRLRRAVGNL